MSYFRHPVTGKRVYTGSHRPGSHRPSGARPQGRSNYSGSRGVGTISFTSGEMERLSKAVEIMAKVDLWFEYRPKQDGAELRYKREDLYRYLSVLLNANLEVRAVDRDNGYSFIANLSFDLRCARSAQRSCENKLKEAEKAVVECAKNVIAAKEEVRKLENETNPKFTCRPTYGPRFSDHRFTPMTVSFL
jgi:hypothetical protein